MACSGKFDKWYHAITIPAARTQVWRPRTNRTKQLQDYYAILGLSPSANAREIQRAFRRLALEFHPDVNRKPGAETRFQEISTAYQVLKDPTRRAEYDSARITGIAPAPKSQSGQQGNARRYYFQRRVRAATDPGSTWNYYDVLGVPDHATEETIARAYQRLYSDFYAGRNEDPGTAAILREILEARDVLIDPAKRIAYDSLPSNLQSPGRSNRQPSTGRRQSPAAQRFSGVNVRRAPRLVLVVGIPLLALAIGALFVLTL